MKNNRSVKSRILIAALGAAMLLAGCVKEDSGAYERALAAFDKEDYDTAMEEFGNAASDDGRMAEGYRGQGMVYLERGDYSYAVKLFDMSLKAIKHDNPEFAEDVLFYKARAQENALDAEGAIETYRTLTESTRAPEAFALMGCVYLKTGDDAAAETAFENALADGPDYDLCLIIYEAYDDVNREGDGAKYLERALTLTPETSSDFMKEGQIYTYLEDYQSARQSLNTAIDRGNEEAVPIMGYICLMQDDISSAKSLYNKVLDTGKKDALAYNGLAMTALHEKQYEEALSYIRMGLNCGNEDMNESLLFNQIVIYEKELDFEMAREKTEEFMKLYPENSEMKSEYKFLKRNFTVLPEG